MPNPSGIIGNRSVQLWYRSVVSTVVPRRMYGRYYLHPCRTHDPIFSVKRSVTVMPKVMAFFPVCRTIGNLTFYMMDGQNFVRKKSSLTAKKVKTSKRFARTRYYAGLMGKASKIGSSLYHALPVCWRQSWMYRTFTGEAMRLLKQGKTEEEAGQILWELYVAEIVSKADTRADAATAAPSTPRRIYTKRHPSFWTIKTSKAIKRKQRREKLLHYAAMLAKASVIASRVYGSVPAYRGKVAFYKGITGLAMALLREELEEIEVKELLMNEWNQKAVDSLPFLRRELVNGKPDMKVVLQVPLHFDDSVSNLTRLRHSQFIRQWRLQTVPLAS